MIDIKITSNKGFTILTLGDETINMTNGEYQEYLKFIRNNIKANTPEEYSKQLKIQIKKLFNNE